MAVLAPLVVGTVVPSAALADAVIVDPPQPVAPLQGTAPARVYDTRAGSTTIDGKGVGAGKLGVRSTRQITLVGRAGISAAMAGVVLNVTVTGTGAPGWIRLWPCARAMPATATMFFQTGQTAAVETVIALGSSALCVQASAQTHLVLDLVDQFTLDSGFKPMQRRLAYTPTLGGLPLAARTWRAFDTGLSSRAGFVTVTAREASGAGFLRVESCRADQDMPTGVPYLSDVNYSAGGTASNLVAVADMSRLCVFSLATTQVVLDIVGTMPWEEGTLSGWAYDPWRAVDTRGQATRLRAGETAEFWAVGNDMGFATRLVNFTVVGAQRPGYLVAWDCGAVPSTSTMNFTSAPRAHLGFVGVSVHSQICVRASTDVDLIMDIVGGYATAVGPFRVTFDSSGCLGGMNPDVFDFAWTEPFTGDYFSLAFAGGTAPYSVELVLPEGWHGTVSVNAEYGVVGIIIEHPLLAPGLYPATVTTRDSAGAVVVTSIPGRTTPYGHLVCDW